METKYNLLVFLILFSISPVFSQLYVNEIMAANKTIIADSYSEYDDWIEIYNNSSSPIDLAGYYLTDDPLDPTQYKIPDSDASLTTVPANGFLLFWADNDPEQGPNHTTFKLSAGGGSIHLYNPNGTTLINEYTFSAMDDDYSFGRKTDSANQLVLFSQSSPLSTNSNGASLTASPVMNPSGGLYSSNQSVTINSTTSGATIYYTTDGAVPTTSSTVYSGPISVSSSKSIRAIAVKNGFENSELITESYIFYSTDLPIITITSDPDGLWSDNNGIHVVGTNGIDGNCMPFPANFNQDWERPATITMIETDGIEVFNTNAGMAVSGGCSRSNPMKSFNISCKSIYGASNFKHQIFSEYTQDKYKRFKLRNGGNGFEKFSMRDVITQSLTLGEIDIDQQRIRPTVVFLNGEYWGIMNIREAISEHYIDETHNIASKDSIDLVRPWNDSADALEGSTDDYLSLYSYIRDNDLANQSKYEHVKTKIDINEYINYQIIQIYVQNTDWPNNNFKIWKEKTPDGKFRWILYDTDFSLGYSRDSGDRVWTGDHTKDALSFATDPNGQGWPNDATSTMFLRKLLQNDEFKNEFTQRFATQMAILFEVNRAQAIADKRYNQVITENPKHLDRWNGTKEDRNGYPMVMNMTKWQDEFDYIKSWMGLRQPFMKQHIKDYFGIGGTYVLSIPVTAQTNGHVVLNTNEYTAPYNYSGEYFNDVPMRIRAIPNPGYKFSHWVETDETDPAPIFTKSGNTTRTPVFVAAENLVINEIHYNPIDGTKEFIEIYNPDSQSKNISGYSFSKGVDLIFPEGTNIAAGEYIIIADSLDHYTGNGYQVFKWKYSNLSNDGENIVLQNPVNQTVDSIFYNDTNPWDKAPDGKDYSLELLHPTLDKSDPLNWFRSDEIGGTPGAENSRICSNAATAIVINEINYNSDNINFDPGDWVELYNPNPASIDLSDWTFYNQDEKYIIPQGVAIPAEGYLLLVEDTTFFNTAFTNLPTNIFIGNLSFSLSNQGERLSLFDKNKCLVDYLVYKDAAPWAVAPDGGGATLALIDPTLDNALSPYWKASDDLSADFVYGSPGKSNQCEGISTTIVCSQIDSSADDAEEQLSDGVVTITSSDLDIVNDEGVIYTVGMRFQNMEIPQGAKITSAVIEFAADEVNTEATSFIIKGENIDNAPAFMATNNNITNRTTTSNNVTWQPDSWNTIGDNGVNQKTVDLSPILQEIIDRPNFAAGNAIALIVHGTGIRTAESFDGDSLLAPTLCITYSSGGCGVNAKLLLEGFYDLANSNMRMKLEDKNLLPLSQPFNTAPWNYTGTESTTLIPSGIVDWILIATRDGNGDIVNQAAGFINQDGVLIGLDGSNGIPIPNAIGKTISVHHKSHLAVISSSLYDGEIYDFTTATSQAEGTDQLKLIDGKYMLYSGDYDGTGIINSNDFNKWKTQSAAINQYLNIDGDGNGIINSLDYNLWQNNKSKVGQPNIRY